MLALLPTQNTYIPTEVINNPQVIQVETKDPEETYPGEACNCYLYTKNRVDSLPRMAEIAPNSAASVGAVAIEYYKGIKHVSVVTSVTSEGVSVIESNYSHCKTGVRFIHFSKPSLVGFWSN